MIREQIDEARASHYRIRWYDGLRRPTVDPGTPDYAFWDRARRGQQEGLQIAGALLKPLASKKAAWVLGQKPIIHSDDPALQAALRTWWGRVHATALLALEESAALGDMFLLIDPAGRLTPLSPHIVAPIFAPDDLSSIVGWQITQVYSDPGAAWTAQTVRDTFTASERRRETQRGSDTMHAQTWQNPLGIVPVVHLANNARADERHGHPEGEALLTALRHYDSVFNAAIAGNIRQGRPTPAFTQMGSAANVEKFLDTFGRTVRRERSDGSSETFVELDFSADDAVIVGEDGRFHYEAPGSFTEDTRTLLEILFYLVVQHSELPEFVFGAAIQGSRASADAQMPPFIRWVEKERGRADGWLRDLFRLAARALALSDPRLNPTAAIRWEWPALTADDGRLTLDTVQFALENGLITPDEGRARLGM